MISNFTNINKAKESLIKQWWSAIPPVFMKRTTTSDWRQKRDHDIGHLCSGLGQAQTCGALKALNYFQSFDFERTSWWRLFQKCVAHTKLDIYAFYSTSYMTTHNKEVIYFRFWLWIIDCVGATQEGNLCRFFSTCIYLYCRYRYKRGGSGLH
jgi:hypothetical protein